jgi:hypothetical protein
MRWFWDEWGIPVVLAAPIVAVYIWLDRHPSLWGTLAFNVGFGGLAGAVAMGGAWLAVALDAEAEVPWWPFVLGGFLLGGWCTTTLPLVLEFPVGVLKPRWLDLLSRVGWTLALSALPVVAWWSAPHVVGRLFAVALTGSATAFLWAPPGPRGVAGGLALVFCVAAALAARWASASAAREAEECGETDEQP